MRVTTARSTAIVVPTALKRKLRSAKSMATARHPRAIKRRATQTVGVRMVLVRRLEIIAAAAARGATPVVSAVAAVVLAVVGLAPGVVAASPAGAAAGRSPVDAAAEVAGAEVEAGRAGQEALAARVGTAAVAPADAADRAAALAGRSQEIT